MEMVNKFIARSAGLLGGLLLATSGHAAMVTQSFNFLSAEFTLRTTVQYENTVDAVFPSSAGLTVHEFTTTLSNFVLPTLRYGWYTSTGQMLFSGGNSPSLDAGIDDVFMSFQPNPFQPNLGYFWRSGATSGTAVTNLSFNQNPFLPPTTSTNVPEPTSLALIGLAGLGLIATRRRRA